MGQTKQWNLIPSCESYSLLNRKLTCQNTCNEKCSSCWSEGLDQCISCAEGLIPYHFLDKTERFQLQCVKECPKNTTLQGSACIKCAENCMSCTGPGHNDCNKCSKGLRMYEGRCVHKCPAHFYIDFKTNSCERCDASCQNCEGPGESNCRSCLSSKLLLNGSCVEACPDNLRVVRGQCVEQQVGMRVDEKILIAALSIAGLALFLAGAWSFAKARGWLKDEKDIELEPLRFADELQKADQWDVNIHGEQEKSRPSTSRSKTSHRAEIKQVQEEASLESDKTSSSILEHVNLSKYGTPMTFAADEEMKARSPPKVETKYFVVDLQSNKNTDRSYQLEDSEYEK